MCKLISLKLDLSFNFQFVVRCVLDREKQIARTDLFNEIRFSTLRILADEGIVYVGGVVFEVDQSLTDVHISLKSILRVSENQGFAAQGCLLNEHEPIEQPEDQPDIVGNKDAMRIGDRIFVLLRNGEYMKPLKIPFAFDGLSSIPVGSYCAIDYIPPADPKQYGYDYVVMSARFIDTYPMEGNEIFINLCVKYRWKGFYYEDNLGVISDSSGLLGYLPYEDDIDPSNTMVTVRIKYTPNQMCLFDITDLVEDAAKAVKEYKPVSLLFNDLLMNKFTNFRKK